MLAQKQGMGEAVCHRPPLENGLPHRPSAGDYGVGLTPSRNAFTAGEWAAHAGLGLVYSLPLASNGHLLPLSFTLALAQILPPRFPREFRSLQG